MPLINLSIQTSVRTILRTLTDISTHGVEIQLKILQTVLPLLNNYRSVHDDILAEVSQKKKKKKKKKPSSLLKGLINIPKKKKKIVGPFDLFSFTRFKDCSCQ
jgi:hypothetical protein